MSQFKYYAVSDTPMSWHQFNRFVRVPVSILSGISLAITSQNPLLWACVFFSVVLGVIFLVNSRKMNEVCYHAMMAYLWCSFGASLLFAMAEPSLLAPTLVAALIWTIIDVIYYKKRRKIFFPKEIPADIMAAIIKQGEEELIEAEYVQRSEAINSADAQPATASPYESHPQKTASAPNRIIIVLLSIIIALGVCIVVLLVRPHYPQTAPIVTATPSPTATASPSPTPTAEPTPEPTASHKPMLQPENGTVLIHKSSLYLLKQSEFTIETPEGFDYCIILVDPEDPSKRCCSIFVEENSTITVNVPKAEFLLYYTVAPASAPWYGCGSEPYHYFGEQGAWSTSEDVFDFKSYSWTITLYPVEGGSWETESISQTQVPFIK